MTEEQKKKRAEHCRNNGYKCKKYNKYEIIDGIAYVTLTNTGRTMLCDADLWEQWKGYGWFENIDNHYVLTNISGKKTKYHQIVLPPKEGYVIDHINRNKLDNRRCNLRYATSTVNNINASLYKNNKSGVKGVRQTKSGKWNAYMWLNKKGKSLGTYNTKEEAIQARQIAEKLFYEPIIKNETC